MKHYALFRKQCCSSICLYNIFIFVALDQCTIKKDLSCSIFTSALRSQRIFSCFRM